MATTAMRATLIACACAVACALGASSAVADASSAVADAGGQAVGYQLDAAHDGYQPNPGFTVPLQRQWSVKEPYYMGDYPLIANGVIYIVVGQNLAAIDLSTGQTLWQDPSIAPNFVIPGLAYGDGQIYAITGATAYDQPSPGDSAGTGVLTAFNAATGAVDWTADLPGEYQFGTAPTAADGYVYVTGDGWGAMVYAVSEGSGQLAWSQSVEGSETSPAVTADGVYTGFTCGLSDDFAPSTGALIWNHDPGCVGGGQSASVIGDGNFYTLQQGIDALILSPGSGQPAGSFGGPLSDYPSSMAVGDGLLYTVADGRLEANADSGLGGIAWSFGDGNIASAPLIAGDVVFADDSSGGLYGLDAATGDLLWSTTFPHDLVGGALAVGDQHLVVASGGELTAYTGVPLAAPVSNPGSSGSSGTSGSSGSGAVASGVPGGAGSTSARSTTIQAMDQAPARARSIPSDRKPPRVLGRVLLGHRVAARTGVWKPKPAHYHYQWLLCSRSGTRCHHIRGATRRFYAPRRADLGHDLRVRVRAEDDTGMSAPVTSRVSMVRR